MLRLMLTPRCLAIYYQPACRVLPLLEASDATHRQCAVCAGCDMAWRVTPDAWMLLNEQQPMKKRSEDATRCAAPHATDARRREPPKKS